MGRTRPGRDFNNLAICQKEATRPIPKKYPLLTALMTPSSPTHPQSSPMYPTEREIPELKRAELGKLLNHRLADSIELRQQLRQSQWNLRGPDFMNLQSLFENVDSDLGFFIEMLVERIAQLGGTVDRSVRPPPPEIAPPALDTSGEPDHCNLRAASHALTQFAQTSRTSALAAQSLGDSDTRDLVLSISQGIDRCLGMFEAHTSSPRTDSPKITNTR